MIKVDALGLACPMPIIKAKKALKEIKEGSIEISVDNKASKENLEKMAKEMKFDSTTMEENGVWKIEIIKKEVVEEKRGNKNTVVVISSDAMGDGDKELGQTLLKGFIYTFTEMEILPETMIFYNAGAYLTSNGSKSIDDLKELEERGVEIITCGACLNFYELDLAVGSVSNMYSIIEKQMKAERIVRA